MLNREDICKLLPHGSGMCLIDRVREYDEEHILCLAETHRDPENPLRNGDCLHTVTAVEYAAQAVGVWLGLRLGGEAKPKAGYVVALRDVQIFRDRLDDAGDTLSIEVRKKLFGENSAICDFSISADDGRLISGQLTLLTEQ